MLYLDSLWSHFNLCLCCLRKSPPQKTSLARGPSLWVSFSTAVSGEQHNVRLLFPLTLMKSTGKKFLPYEAPEHQHYGNVGILTASNRFDAMLTSRDQNAECEWRGSKIA